MESSMDKKFFEEARREVLANPSPELKKAREELEYMRTVLAVFEGRVKIIERGNK